VLQSEGADFDRVVKITFYLTDIRDEAAVWEERKAMFELARPASTLVEVSHLVDPLALLEVAASPISEAKRSENRSGRKEISTSR
jgi:enamine deaminase RidA (YjgF/YER057c/UK114 family)